MTNTAFPPANRVPLKLSPVLAVFLVALALRLFVLCQAANTPEFLPDQGDMKFYSDWAKRIAAGTLTDHKAFYGLPGYAYWLALIYKVVGFQPYVAALLQVIAEAVTSTLIYRLGILAFGQREDARPSTRAVLVGAVAALGWVFFVPAQAYSTILMPTCYLITAFWSVVWWVLRRREERPAARAFFLLGLMMGVVAMMVANILFLIPLVLVAVWLHREWSPVAQPFSARARAWASALLLTGVGMGIAPCVYHNYILAGEPVALSAHSGINFYIGNNAQANGYPKIPSPLHTDQQGMLRDSIVWAERAEGRPLKRVEVSAFWAGLAKRYIREHPLQWLGLLGTKLQNFWRAFPYDDLGIISSFQEDGVLLPGIGFGLVAILALPGLVLAVKRRPASRWIVAAIGLHVASLMTVFVTERYRMAVVPGLLLLASFGLAEVWRDLSTRRWTGAGVYGVALVAAWLVVERPVAADLQYLDEYNSSLTDMEQGRYGRAQQKLEHSLVNNPDSAETNFAMGNVYLAEGQRDLAKKFYRRTLQLDPAHDRVLNNLGVLASEESRWPLAEKFLQASLEIDASDAKTHYLLARARREQGNLPGATTAIDEAIRLQPGQPEFQRLAREISDPAPASRFAFPGHPSLTCNQPRPLDMQSFETLTLDLVPLSAPSKDRPTSEEHPTFDSVHRTQPWTTSRLVVLAFSVAALKLACAALTVGSNDVYAFRRFAAALQTMDVSALYRQQLMFNHTPAVAAYLTVLGSFANESLRQFAFFLRLPAILADLALVLFFLKQRRREPLASCPGWALALFIASPVSFLVSGFHGNFDSVVVLFLALSAWMCVREQPAASGLFLGLSLQVKVPAMIVLPVFLIYWYRHGALRRFTACLALICAVGFAEPLVRDPVGFLRNVFGYSSCWGTWGVTYWLVYTFWEPLGLTSFGQATPAEQVVTQLLKLVIMSGVTWLAWTQRPFTPAKFIPALAFAWSLFFFLTPGAGVQYVVWLAPFVLLADPRWYRGMTICCSLYCYFFYRITCHSWLPYADHSTWKDYWYWGPWMLLAWVGTSYGVYLFWQRARPASRTPLEV